MSDEDYQQTYWLKLGGLVDLLFTRSESERSSVSYEEMYSCVYKCVCSCRGPQLRDDLLAHVAKHLDQQSLQLLELHQQDGEEATRSYVEAACRFMERFVLAANSIVAVFQYMSRVMLPGHETQLISQIDALCADTFLAQHQEHLLPALCEVAQRPFALEPAALQSLVQALHRIRPELAKMAPQLFARYIPGVLPVAVASQLSAYRAEERQLQRDLRCHPSFIQGDRSRKRHCEEHIEELGKCFFV